MAYPIDPNKALSMEAYREAAFAAEQERVFRGGWVFVATADQVAEPGDHLPVELGGQPVIVLRRQDGTLAAMSNLCAHRGTLLIDSPGNAKRIQCPYHAWTYADDGRLLSVPYVEPDELSDEAKADLCLPTYRAEEWNGLVFVDMAADGPSVAERLAHLDDVVAPHDLGSLHHWTSQRGDEVWEANWKLVITNAMESYHLFKVHPETLEPYTPTAGAFYIAGTADGTATGGSYEDDRNDYVLLSLPPNFVGVITRQSLLWQAVFPLAAGRSRIVTGGAYPSTDPAESSGLTGVLKRGAAAAAEALVPDFLPEDKAIGERGQRATTGEFHPGPILEVERVVRDFHAFLQQRLT